MSSIMEIWKVSAKIKGAKISSNQEELSFNGWQKIKGAKGTLSEVFGAIVFHLW